MLKRLMRHTFRFEEGLLGPASRFEASLLYKSARDALLHRCAIHEKAVSIFYLAPFAWSRSANVVEFLRLNLVQGRRAQDAQAHIKATRETVGQQRAN